MTKMCKSEQIPIPNATVLLHKRPYQHNLVRLETNSFGMKNENNDNVTLETASFKRKIRKPLKFESHWQQTVKNARGLKTQRQQGANYQFFDLKN